MFFRYRAMLCGSTLLMVGLSWPLWVDDHEFPRVPFLRGWIELPPWISWLVLAGIIATLALAMLGAHWRLMLRVNLTLLVLSILQDQNRFQPWAYQYAMIGMAMACMSRARALRMARWYVFGLYFYSGLSKLDDSFCRELGPTFLSAALEPFGLNPGRWTEATRMLACLSMPAFEIAVAWLLLFNRTRRVGLVGAVAQHSALIWILGPWNLNHSAIVLVWNVALIIEVVQLFGGSKIPTALEVNTKLGSLAGQVFWIAMILPGGERLGLCDAWPGHALYASHAERSDVFVHEGDLDRYPQSIIRCLESGGATPWRRVNLTGWSRDIRGTPLYPSGRVGNAVAEFLEERFAGPQPVRLVQWGRARAWDGARERDESVGIRAIVKRADRFWLNARVNPSVRP
jgi:hypothetical protein